MEIISKIEKDVAIPFVGAGLVPAQSEDNFVDRVPTRGTPTEFIPEDILDYIYAVLHSKTYRETYKEFLKIDFPKIPYPKDTKNFFELVKLGRELRSFHLLQNAKVWEFITSYPLSGDNLVEKVRYVSPDS